MSSSIGSPEFADSFMVERLGAFGLALRYVRAEGNTLYHLTEDGGENGVLDGVSGFGSLMFGHNNPEIVEHAKRVLDDQTPVHAQMGGYSYALNLAAELNTIVRRELGTGDKFWAQFGNTGAEAVEIAIKHAELDRIMRIGALKAGIEANIEAARAALAGGATVTDAAAAMLGGTDIDHLAAEIARRNGEVEARPPLFLALESGFHGKLIGSVQLTYNPMLRGPFRALAAQARFAPKDQPEMVAKVMEQERASLLDLVVQGDTVDVVERDFPVFTAAIVEPIMGEAGIYPITAEMASALREACDTYGVPLISDEVQSGMGRSGTFLAGTQVGLKPDYIVLAKALGGGIAKLGVVLIHERWYHREFEFIHSSTFAKDGFSTRIALKVLEMLEADGGKAYQLAAEQGAKAKAAMERVRADYPEIIKEVRGKGLMLGFEFHDQAESAQPAVREAHQGVPFLIMGHLHRAHRFRIARTASGPWTFRFEPSIYLSDAEIAQVEAAFRDVADILRSGDLSRFR